MSESKNEKFRRLAKLRGERVLNDIRLLANLSNRNNYEYSEYDIKRLFSPIEEEIRIAKTSFGNRKKREIDL